LAREEVVTVEDIAKAGIIAAPLNNLEWSYYGRVLRQCGLQDAAPILEIDGIQARALAAAAGLGVFATFCPPYAGEQAFAPLVPLRVARPLPSQEVVLVSRAGDTLSQSSRAFADVLRELVRGRPPREL
jgi:DNA-binding transcriptional LysR family regulator